MGAFSILERILGVARIVSRATEETFGDRLKEWGRYVEAEPLNAAASYEALATELEAMAESQRSVDRRFGQRFRARVAGRLEARAEVYRKTADGLRRRHADPGCAVAENIYERPPT